MPARERRPFPWLLFWIGCSATTVLMLFVGCSTLPDATGCTPGEIVACTCGARTGTSECGSLQCSCDSDDAGVTVSMDAALDVPMLDTPGDATHLDEKTPPATGYEVCAVQGSFGWPCYLDASGPDMTECTDPNFPDCFVGGQSAWCTASCATFGICPGSDQDGGDAGCVPVACNARGFCK